MRRILRLRNRAAMAGIPALRSAGGNAAIEFGLIGPLLALLLIGLVDVGYYAYQRADMFAAARSGTQYFMSGGADPQAARDIIWASWTEAPGDAAVAVDRLCLCEGAASACNAPCDDGEPPITYTRIVLSGTFQGLATSIPYQTSDLIRIR